MNKLKIVRVLIEMPFIILTFVLFSVSIASATQWVKTFGGVGSGAGYDCASSIQQTSDGDYIVAGRTESFGSNVWILKLDNYGNVLMQKSYGLLDPDNYEVANSIQQTSDGGYIVAGENYHLTGYGFAWIFKLDAGGNFLWQKYYSRTDGDVIANSIQQTSDGGYIVAGYICSSSGDAGIWVLRLDLAGNIQWQKIYAPGGVSSLPMSIQQTADGGYIVASGRSDGSNHNAWILKLDSNGNVQWQKTFGTGYDHANFIQQTSDGDYIVAGVHEYWGSFAWVLKLDANGNVQWQKTYGGDTDAMSVQQTSDKGYIIAGFYKMNGSWDGYAWVLKLDANGNVQWQKNYGGALDNWANSVRQTSDGGYLLAGGTYSFRGTGSADAWVLKLDSNGDIYNCSIVKTANAQVSNTDATVQDTNVIGVDTSVSPQTSTASVSDTNAVVTELCKYGCNLVPGATVIPKGGTLGLQATATNYSDQSGTALIASKVKKPDGLWYPASGFIVGPNSHSFEPYQSKSWYKTHTIPLTAPTGIYTYHGYVGNYGVGNYSECTFNFEVTP